MTDPEPDPDPDEATREHIRQLEEERRLAEADDPDGLG